MKLKIFMLSPMKIGLKIELINYFLSTKVDSLIIIFFLKTTHIIRKISILQHDLRNTLLQKQSFVDPLFNHKSS
ncbi:hypothetical protein LSO12E_90064 [Candidatus Liberibacter solanacearum]